VSGIGASDSGHGSQLHAQTYLQHALLAAQQKAQVNAFSQQKVSKPVPQAGPHDHSGPSNLQVCFYTCLSFPTLGLLGI
jgi:hypothetical protein